MYLIVLELSLKGCVLLKVLYKLVFVKENSDELFTLYCPVLSNLLYTAGVRETLIFLPVALCYVSRRVPWQQLFGSHVVSWLIPGETGTPCQGLLASQECSTVLFHALGIQQDSSEK